MCNEKCVSFTYSKCQHVCASRVLSHHKLHTQLRDSTTNSETDLFCVPPSQHCLCHTHLSKVCYWTSVCVCVCLCRSEGIHACMLVFVLHCLCMCVHVGDVSVFVCVCVQTHACMYTYVCVFVCVCVCVCCFK